MRRLLLLGTLGAVAACSDPSPPHQQARLSQEAPAAVKVARPAAVQGQLILASYAPALAPDLSQAGAAPAAVADANTPALAMIIDQAGSPASGPSAPPSGWTIKGVDPSLIKAEVLLDRAGLSPGVIDGEDGQNL